MSMNLHSDQALAYRLRRPPVPARRLLILAHGVGNETNLAPLAQYAPDNTLVALVRGPLTLAPGQHAWFQVSFGAQGPRPDLIAAESSRVQLAAFIAGMQSAHGIAPSATVVSGFSQGGIISASVALTRPELVCGFGVLAGRILPELESQLADREALGRLHAFIGHGRDDTKLPVEWAHRADAWLTELGVAHDTHLYPGDHGVAPVMQADFFAWFSRTTSCSDLTDD